MTYVFILDGITKNEPEDCCDRPSNLKNPYCNEIPVPDDDYFFGKFNVKCINFVRSFPGVRPGCRLGKSVCQSYFDYKYLYFIFIKYFVFSLKTYFNNKL